MKVLIIGLGSIAKKHIVSLNNLVEECQIFALRSQSDSQHIIGVTNIYSIENLENDFDFAIVSNPTSKHGETIKLLIKLNIPLFIEKPLFDSLNYKEVVNEININKINTYVACNLRFLECISYIKDAIIKERINEVNVYCGSYLPDWRPGVDYRKCYSANKELGGGVHIDLIHEIDYIYWLFLEPKSVHNFFYNKSSLNISSYDSATYLFEYDNFSVNVRLNYYRRDPKRTLEIVCEKGTYLVDLLKNSVLLDGIEVFKSSKTIFNTYNSQMNFFVSEVLKAKVNNFNNINEAYKILELCLKT
jgi:predicted dehydrogenase